jgi:hypothetical protein
MFSGENRTSHQVLNLLSTTMPQENRIGGWFRTRNTQGMRSDCYRKAELEEKRKCGPVISEARENGGARK